MTDIKIKRCADKENLKKLMRYIKATFANKTELASKANTSDLSTVATSGSYNDLLDKPTSFDVDLSNYYTKSEVDNLLSNIGSGTEGGDDTQGGLSFYTATERASGSDETSQITIAEDADTVEDE